MVTASAHGRIVVLLLSVGVGVAGGGCAPGAIEGWPAWSGASGAIIGGSNDTTHDAVLALVQVVTATTGYACSGTTIAQSGTSAFLMTAAHCVVQHDAMLDEIVKPVTIVSPSSLTVVPGPDWKASVAQSHTFSVAAVAVAPGYDGASDSPNDLAVVRFVTAMPSLPLIPILEPTDDALAVGTVLTLVGYGITTVGGENSVRHTIDRPIDTLNAQHLFYLQNDMKGQCSGDSGGPALARVGGAERVAGVIAYMTGIAGIDLTCSLQAASVRTSSLASFVHSIVGAPASPDAGPPVDAARAPDASTGGDATLPADSGPGTDAADGARPPPACGKVTDPRPACVACIAARCCTEAAVCGADPLCLGCGANPLPSCQAYPPSAILTACLATCSGNPCGVALDSGVPASDAGSSDGRVADAAGDASGPPESPPDAARPASDGPQPEASGARDAAVSSDAGASNRSRDGASDKPGEPPGSSGCSCELGRIRSEWSSGAALLAGLLAIVRTRRRTRLVAPRDGL